MLTVECQIGPHATLAVHRFEVREAVSALFEVEVVVRTPDAALDLAPLIGADASLVVTVEAPSSRRRWAGIVARAEQLRAVDGGASDELTEYRFRIVPTVWRATQNAQHRVFQHRTIPEIAEEVLRDHGAIELKIDRAAHPKLEYRVQYGEADLAFVGRLLEETGISYAFVGGDGAGSLLLSDAPTSSPMRRHDALPFDPTPSVQTPVPRVRAVTLSADHRPARHTVTDYDFRNPALAFQPTASARSGRPGEPEVHEYLPGRAVAEREPSGASTTPAADDRGFARTDRAHGDAQATRRSEADRAGRLGIAFESNQIELAAGSVVKIEQHPHPMLGSDVLVIETSIRGEVPGRLHVSHTAVSAVDPYRTPLRTPRPRVTGMQSARVTGPAGEEIHVDEHGRVRVLFPWDRGGTPDERSSCWIRVADGWAGVGFGMIALPRVGQEVLVAFLEGDPDQPVVVGRMYNQLNPVPYRLPENKTISALRTCSSPVSGGYNELKFEDKRDRELVYSRAQRDRHELVLRDQRTRVERKHHHTTVDDEHHVVKQKRKELVLAESHLHVVGDRREKFDAKLGATVGSDWEVRVGSKWAVESGSEIHVKAGSTLVIEAGARITLKGPGGFIDIHAGGVDVVGTMVRINSGGSAGAGSGAAPVAPEDAEEAQPMDVSLD